ncbi:MAG: hypothetical protein DRN30_03830 [Thermoplasmata archaeon]|nr:MAG: hypothetical protein DRN30_03830 [Thermoplasmata archaeon]
MELEDMRKLFPMFSKRQVVYFASCSYGPLSEPVKRALLKYMNDWESKGMNWDFWMEKYEELRSEAAKLLGASRDEIAIVSNVTSGLAAFATSLEYNGKKVVLSDLNFPTVGHVWLSQQRLGAKVSIVYSESWKISIDALEKVVDDNTIVLSEPRVCYQSGFTYSNIRALSKIAHEHGAYFVLDDAQATGVLDIDVKKADVDVLVTTTLKYLMGGAGVGIMYVRKDIVDDLSPLTTGWFGQEEPFAFDIHKLDYARSARRFETGSPAVPSILTSLESIKLIRNIGVKRIESRVKDLVKYATDLGLSHGMKVLSPKDEENMGPIFAFEHEDPHGLYEMLLDRGIVVSPRGPAVRVSFHFFNTKEEIELLFDNLRDLNVLR